MREPRHYDPLKAEHASADHSVKQQAVNESDHEKVSWDDQMQIDMQAEKDAVAARFKAGGINARDMVREQNMIDRNYQNKIHDRNKEEAEARGETYNDPRRGPSPYADGVLRDGSDRERER